MITSLTSKAGIRPSKPFPNPTPLPHQTPRVVCRAQKVSSSSKFTDPYAVLGIPSDSDEHVVKQAFRKLAKQYHPDVAKDPSHADGLQFLNITEAYEFLLQLMRSKHQGPQGQQGNSEAFHDWYWSFRMSRTWERQTSKAAGPDDRSPPQPASQPQDPEALRSQLAGLRHRAAIRKNRPATATTTAAEGTTQDETTTSSDGAEQWFAVAEGPSDSADPSLRQPQPAMVHDATPTAAPEPQAASAKQEVEDAPAQQQQAQPRRKFVANDDVREGLKAQLHGMRRKAQIRHKFHQASCSPDA